MLDTVTGDLIIESVPIRIGTSFSRKDFCSSTLATDAKVIVSNEPHCSFSVGSYEISGLRLNVSLWFYGERLEAVELSYDSKELSSSWSDWSEKKELQRKEIHDQRLASTTGNESYFYSWGEVWSGYDAKSGGSLISIRYPWQGKSRSLNRAT